MKHFAFAAIILLIFAISCAPALTPELARATSIATQIAATSTPLPTITPTITPQSSPTATIFQFRAVNIRTGKEIVLTGETERLRKQAEATYTACFPRMADEFVEFGVDFGDPSNPLFVFFYGDYGVSLSVRTLGGGKYELVISRGSLHIWPSYWGQFQEPLTLPLPSDSKVIYDSMQSQVGIDDQSGKIVNWRQLDFIPQCAASGQRDYVYAPRRLGLLNLCVRVNGIVKSISSQGEGDGDFTFEVALDPPFTGYINDENRKHWRGNLHVEIVCYSPVHMNFEQSCDNFPESLRILTPAVGQHIWMEGQWVLDNWHEGWAELHPLYRWGPLN